MTDCQTIRVEIAPGELIDKITILEIKAERITDPVRLCNVRHELQVLRAARDAALEQVPALGELTRQLRQVNEDLWDIEDRIRRCEKQQDFGAEFIQLARSVYHSNDRRAEIKRQINDMLGSTLIEEKQYVRYDT